MEMGDRSHQELKDISNWQAMQENWEFQRGFKTWVKNGVVTDD